MNKIATVNNNNLTIKEYNGQRVITFKDIDEVHNISKGTSRKNFTRNKTHFILNEDYFILSKSEVGDNMSQTFGFGKSANTGMLLTESGYLMIAKSLTDEKAWQIQRQLVNTYFKAKEIAQNVSQYNDTIVKSLLDGQQMLQNAMQSQLHQLTTLTAIITSQLPQPYKPPYTRWMGRIYEKIDKLAEHNGMSRRQMLHKLYNEFQDTYEIDLSEYQYPYCVQHNIENTNLYTMNTIGDNAQVKQWFDLLIDTQLEQLVQKQNAY